MSVRGFSRVVADFSAFATTSTMAVTGVGQEALNCLSFTNKNDENNKMFFYLSVSF